ncbi:MAG: translation initiation factor IF-2 [Solirubrobacterales bacterium]|nr:MAG: translation initiation factor IF-2 [Solirubrobacterales bacterium]
MSKRVHEIAKERGLQAKDVLERLRAAGVNVKAVSSSVDEQVATRVLGNGGPPVSAAAPRSAPASEASPPASAGGASPRAPAGEASPRAPAAGATSETPIADASTEASPRAASGEGPSKRPTRDSLQGERAPGNAGGRRRVVIDSQASRRTPGGGPPQSNQPPRRQRRGRRRRGVYDEEAESRPAASRMAVAEPDAIRINSGSTVKGVAEYLGVPVPEVMKKLMALGEMKTLTQTLSDESIGVLAAELGKDVEIVHSEDEAVAEPIFNDSDEQLVERAPVVTIMGHVDHGKTSLLDAIRETEVAAGEAGGITQHIGAYQVHHNGKSVTFLDTPGHEAFTAMRARGAKVTDVAVIVVAADDGVKPQTQEAVDHAKEAGVPILVAVNKIDKEGAQPDRVRTEMTQLGLQPVQWGGETEFVDVSAKTREGLDDLLETIVVMSEVEELRANPDAPASGTVIESKLDPGRGPVVTILIVRGTLEVGDALVAGANWGRVRAMHDFMGNRVAEALPGEPVEVLGFDGVPEAGERVRVVDHDRRARQLAGERATRLKTESLARRSGKRVSLEDIFKAGLQELNLVLKSDVAGSLEAIEDEIAKLPQDEVSVNVIRRAVGAVTESDVMLAAASDAVILAFGVRPVGDARALAEREGVEIRHYSVIYRAIEELRGAMQGMLAPEEVEEVLGSAEVREIFRASRVGTIAGSHVSDGRITRGASVRLVRDGTVVYDGVIASLRRFNDDVREVAAGFDCGIVLRDFADIKQGDVLETYATRLRERELA